MTRLRTIASTLIALALAAACSTPSVPLPPPAVDTSALAFDSPADDTVVLVGQPRELHANARFYLIDIATGDGVITQADADGSFTTPPLKTRIGDVAKIYFDRPDGKRSETTCLTVLLQQALFSANCP